MCPHRHESEAEACAHCPPLKLMQEFNYIIDFYFDFLKQYQRDQKEKKSVD